MTTKTAVAILAASLTAACAGTPTSPSRQLAGDDAATTVTSSQTQANSGQQSGTASTVFVEVSPGLFGFPAGTRNGVSGRVVTLAGDIAGTNFEPGECVPGVDMTLGFPTSCVLFGEGPGQFIRAHAGSTAFTTCECSVAGVGAPGDQVTLKISYPPATPPQYPGGFTKFTFQDGTGALQGLRGQGTLNFALTEAVSFAYHFVGQ